MKSKIESSLIAINATLNKTNELLSDLAQLIVFQIQTLQKILPEEDAAEENATSDSKNTFDPKSIY